MITTMRSTEFERLRDWYESDPDGAEVELPDINRCLPEMIKRRPLSDRTAIAMVARSQDPTARELMELALELDRVSRRIRFVIWLGPEMEQIVH